MTLVKVLSVEFSCFLMFKSKPTDFKIDGSLHKGHTPKANLAGTMPVAARPQLSGLLIHHRTHRRAWPTTDVYENIFTRKA